MFPARIATILPVLPPAAGAGLTPAGGGPYNGPASRAGARAGGRAGEAVGAAGPMDVHPGELWTVAALSLRISLAAVAIGAAAGIPLGTWIGLTRSRARPAIVALVHTGMALPPVLVGLVLYLLLSRRGPLGALGWLFTPRAMVLAQALLALPFVVGMTAAAVAAVPAELHEQLLALGADARQARRLVLREAAAGLALAVAAALGRSLSEVGAVLIVGGNIAGHTRVLTTAIVLETARGRFGVALGLGAVLLTLALALNAVLLALRPRTGP